MNEAVGNHMFKGDGLQRLVFWTGISLFFSVRFYLLLVTSYFSRIPRLGDDALVYLWGGTLHSFQSNQDSVGMQTTLLERTLAAQAKMPDGGFPQIAERAIGGLTPFSDLYYALFSGLGMDLKWTLFFSELFGLVLMTLAFALLLNRLFGAGAAGIGMGLMAFAIFPNQGIYSYIPSTLVLSVGILLWVYVIKERGQISTWKVGVLSLVLSGLHPIGKAYALLAIPLHFIRQGRMSVLRTTQTWWLYGATVAGVVSYALYAATFMGGPLPVNTMAIGGVVENITAAVELLQNPWFRKNSLLVVLFVFGLLYWRHCQELLVAKVLVFFGAVLLGSLLHYLPGYPAELFTRFLVVFSLLAAGVAGRFVVWRWAQIRWRKTFRLLLGFWLLVTMALFIRDYSFQKINERPELVDQGIFAQRLATMTPGSNLIYFDSIVLFQEGLILGASQFSALHHEYLKLIPQRNELLDDYPPHYLFALFPNELNSIAVAKLKSFEPRRYGVFMGEVNSMSLIKSKTETGVSIHVDNPGESFVIMVNDKPLIVADEFDGWVSLPPDVASVETIGLVFPPVDAWLDGIRFGRETEALQWPWNDAARLVYSYRNQRKQKQTVKFGVDAFLQRYDAGYLRPYLPDRAVVDDRGGLLVLRTNRFTETSPM